mmetsp:Transcript_58317/g.102569  ORF Transcript_58317/g.102569 Transcript_58317/m.102569 type:complete len:290 (-) Transcript_58317:522-1391(-)
MEFRPIVWIQGGYGQIPQHCPRIIHQQKQLVPPGIRGPFRGDRRALELALQGPLLPVQCSQHGVVFDDSTLVKFTCPGAATFGFITPDLEGSPSAGQQSLFQGARITTAFGICLCVVVLHRVTRGSQTATKFSCIAGGAGVLQRKEVLLDNQVKIRLKPTRYIDNATLEVSLRVVFAFVVVIRAQNEEGIATRGLRRVHGCFERGHFTLTASWSDRSACSRYRGSRSWCGISVPKGGLDGLVVESRETDVPCDVVNQLIGYSAILSVTKPRAHQYKSHVYEIYYEVADR